jgi:hypothetical protein
MAITEERRQHRRLPVRISVHCRRLGRGGFDETVHTADFSVGGALLRADRRLGVGDVVALDVAVGSVTLGLKGLVIATREIAGRTDERHVHVAFTGMSPERSASLARLLDDWSTEAVET